MLIVYHMLQYQKTLSLSNWLRLPPLSDINSDILEFIIDCHCYYLMLIIPYYCQYVIGWPIHVNY